MFVIRRVILALEQESEPGVLQGAPGVRFLNRAICPREFSRACRLHARVAPCNSVSI